jgi:WD40 repeat protein
MKLPRQEFIVIHRDEKRLETNSKLDGVERLAKILSLIAIPILIAVIGSHIQDAIAKRSVNQEYVRIAVSILSKKPEEVETPVREWAVGLLNAHAPISLPKALAKGLLSGELSLLPTLQNLMTNGAGAIAISPDGKIAAVTYDDGIVRMLEVTIGKLVSTILRHEDKVTSVLFSPDGKKLISASFDGTVRFWNIQTSQELSTIRHDAAVIGIATTPDGTKLLTRTIDNSLRTWDLASGELIYEFVMVKAQ